MLIGILETGRPPPDMNGQYPDYPEAFELLLSNAAPDWKYQAFAALEDQLPDSPDQCDAWIITGSRFGAYDPDPWIARLQAFLQLTYSARVPMVGICFGHQLLAQALGGRVIKSPRGWGVGVHQYRVENPPAWMSSIAGSFSIQAFHQDQVVEVPVDAAVVASSDFCPNAALVYGDQAVSFQGHPEMSRDFASELLEARRGVLIPDPVADTALRRMNERADDALVARWIVQFVHHALAGNCASVVAQS